jgi:tetratricopeptide (TPR) repeat protein
MTTSRSRPWVKLGTTALDAGDFEVALRWLTAALRSLPDGASPRRITLVLTQRGRAHQGAGDFTSARIDLEQAYATARSANDLMMIAMSAAALGDALVDMGEPQRAREYLESALSETSMLDGEDVASLLDALAQALLAKRDLAGARQQLERALSIRRNALATDDHPDIAASLCALGDVLTAQGDIEGARAYLDLSLTIFKRLGTPEHPKVAGALRALANLHRHTGDLRGARAHLERALSIEQVTLGLYHPETAETLVALARVLAATGALDAAQAALQDALAIQQGIFGDDGQLGGVTTRRELASVLVAKGDLTGAIKNLQQTLATLRRIFKFKRGVHPDIASTLSELELLRALQGDLQRTD